MLICSAYVHAQTNACSKQSSVLVVHCTKHAIYTQNVLLERHLRQNLCVCGGWGAGVGGGVERTIVEGSTCFGVYVTVIVTFYMGG